MIPKHATCFSTKYLAMNKLDSILCTFDLILPIFAPLQDPTSPILTTMKALVPRVIHITFQDKTIYRTDFDLLSLYVIAALALYDSVFMERCMLSNT